MFNYLLMLRGAQGWEWVDEGKLKHKPKWGFVTRSVDSQIELAVRVLSQIATSICIRPHQALHPFLFARYLLGGILAQATGSS